MKCKKCKDEAVLERPCLCNRHFTAYFEDKVKNTIYRFGLISKKDIIAVGASGGKDSTVTLFLLKRIFGNVHAIALDEGISGYRAKTLRCLSFFCKKYKIPLKIYRYKKEAGFNIDDIAEKVSYRPCSACGTLRRHILNAKSKGFTRLATGHNLDDEAQSIMMNLLRGDVMSNAKLGPFSGISLGNFIQRVKPLYLCTEKEVRLYSLLMGLDAPFTECTYAKNSFRAYVRDMLNEHEDKHLGTKERIVRVFLKALPKLKALYRQDLAEQIFCKRCGEPSSKEICQACSVIQRYSKLPPTIYF